MFTCPSVPHFKTLTVNSEWCRFSSGGNVLSKLWNQKVLINEYPKVACSFFLSPRSKEASLCAEIASKLLAIPKEICSTFSQKWLQAEEPEQAWNSVLSLPVVSTEWIHNFLEYQTDPAQFAPSFSPRVSFNPHKHCAALSGPEHQIEDDDGDFFIQSHFNFVFIKLFLICNLIFSKQLVSPLYLFMSFVF